MLSSSLRSSAILPGCPEMSLIHREGTRQQRAFCAVVASAQTVSHQRFTVSGANSTSARPASQDVEERSLFKRTILSAWQPRAAG